ncbi:MAG: hypothetical protein ACI9R3_001794 [Verrucomicrobiales bacterium]
MNKNLYVHGAWLTTATGAFIAGSLFFPAEKELSFVDGRAATGQSGVPFEGAASASSENGTSTQSNGGRKNSMASSVKALTDRDIEALGETFRKASSPIDRRLAFSNLLEGLTADNALLVREQIAHMDHRSAEFREFHYAWGTVAGVEAAMFGASTPEDDMSPALAGWASASPAEAMAWFNTLDMESDPGFEYLLKERKLSSDNLRQHLMNGLVQGLADANPDTASRFVSGLMEKGQKGAARMMHVVAQAVMRTDGAASAAAWSADLPEGAPRTVAMHRTANGLANEDPVAAAEWAAQLDNTQQNAGVLGEVGVTWSRKDPLAALEWLGSIAEGHGQNVGMHRTLDEWAKRDPTAASEYLATMPESPAKDSAITGFTGRLAWEDPHSAIAWAETISSEEARLSAISQAGTAWARKDPTAAAEWVQSTTLPDNMKETILNPPPKNERRR